MHWFAIFPIIFSISFWVLYIRNYIFGKKFNGFIRYDQKNVIVITGSASGIGLETAIEVAKRGATVILANSDFQKSTLAKEEIIKKTRNKNIIVMHLDLESFRSIKFFREKLISYLDDAPLTALINAEEIAESPYCLTEDSYERTFQINYLGPFLLISLLIPLLLKSYNGVLVNVSSAAYSSPDVLNATLEDLNIGKPSDPESFDMRRAYALSKRFLAYYTLHLAYFSEKNHYTGFKVYSVDPGNYVNSKFHRFSSIAEYIYKKLPQFLKFLMVKTPNEACQGILVALNGSVLSAFIKDVEVQFEFVELLLNRLNTHGLYEQSMLWTGQELPQSSPTKTVRRENTPDNDIVDE